MVSECFGHVRKCRAFLDMTLKDKSARNCWFMFVATGAPVAFDFSSQWPFSIRGRPTTSTWKCSSCSKPRCLHVKHERSSSKNDGSSIWDLCPNTKRMSGRNDLASVVSGVPAQHSPAARRLSASHPAEIFPRRCAVEAPTTSPGVPLLQD